MKSFLGQGSTSFAITYICLPNNSWGALGWWFIAELQFSELPLEPKTSQPHPTSNWKGSCVSKKSFELDYDSGWPEYTSFIFHKLYSVYDIWLKIYCIIYIYTLPAEQQPFITLWVTSLQGWTNNQHSDRLVAFWKAGASLKMSQLLEKKSLCIDQLQLQRGDGLSTWDGFKMYFLL